MASRGAASCGRLAAAAIGVPGGDEEELDEAELEAARCAVVLADPARYQDAEVVYATDAAEYSFAARVVRGEVTWPPVPVARSGGLLIVA